MKETTQSMDTELKSIKKLIEEVKTEKSEREKQKDFQIDQLN